MTTSDVPFSNKFLYRKPDAETAQKLTRLREKFATLCRELEAELPSNRERSLAFTHLEEASMWAVKAAIIHLPAAEA